ncbi:MAG TPA: hypothetical protein PKK95_13865 [Vicinamibacterales bacterium]|nr:hypothetical protein [Vicinamibacterales bacterium]
MRISWLKEIVVQSCPKCRSTRIHRSRSRGWFERFRKGFTNKRPHRCHACGWRGWGLESDNHREKGRSAGIDCGLPDLTAIDEAIGFERDGASKRASR